MFQNKKENSEAKGTSARQQVKVFSSYAENLKIWIDALINNSKDQQFEKLSFQSTGTLFQLMLALSGYKSACVSLHLLLFLTQEKFTEQQNNPPVVGTLKWLLFSIHLFIFAVVTCI